MIKKVRFSIWRAIRCAAIVMFGACSSSGQVPVEHKGSMLQGDRRESAERRTSKNRPRPWDDGHGPHETDRLGVGSARAHRQEEHLRHHQTQSDHMVSFSHPACEELTTRLKSACPFTTRKWTIVRTLEHGVEFKTKGKFKGRPGRTLRRQILCHIAFGRGREVKDKCPLHVEGVRAITHVREDVFVLRLETSPPAEVGELQTRAKDLE